MIKIETKLIVKLVIRTVKIWILVNLVFLIFYTIMGLTVFSSAFGRQQSSLIGQLLFSLTLLPSSLVVSSITFLAAAVANLLILERRSVLQKFFLAFFISYFTVYLSSGLLILLLELLNIPLYGFMSWFPFPHMSVIVGP